MTNLTRRAALIAAAAIAPRIASAQADPRPVITIAVQRIATSNTLCIINEASNVGTRHYNSYHEPLIDTDWTGDLSLRPGLAEAWTQIDGRTVEFKLRQGVKFHNGDTLTAQDVAFTFGERMFGTDAERAAVAGAARDPNWAPAKVRAGAATAFPAIERIEIIDPHTIRFINKNPDVTLLGRISMRVGSIVNARQHREAASWFDWARKPVGTGPYKVAEYVVENRLILDAFDDYWGGKPPIRQLRFIEVPELSSRINGLLSGQYDFACDITPDQIDGIDKTAKFEVKGGLITNMRVLNFDTHFPALADKRVRLAMSLAVDRAAIVETIWGGRTRVPRGSQYPFFGPMYILDHVSPSYDPARARTLLKDAGYNGAPIPYRLVNNYYTNQTTTAQALVEMWRAVGLNVQLEIKENWGQVLATNVPRAINDNSMTAFFNDPVSFIPSNFGVKGDMPLNGFWKNAEAEAQVAILEASTDMATRQAAIRRIMTIAETEDPALIILHETANFSAKRRDIQWQPAKSFVMDFRSRNFKIG